MRPWKTHLDYQLYKALEHQYRTGLEVMNEHLPELKVELTYRSVLTIDRTTQGQSRQVA